MPQPAQPYYTSEDYWNLPDGQRAELIDGQLYDMTPPSIMHQTIAFRIAHSFQNHVEHNGGPCRVLTAPVAVNLDADDSTWVEPDVLVVCDPAKLSARACEGAPDLVVEVVSPSSQYNDYMRKLPRYERAGVREYWIVDPDAARTLVYRFEKDGASPTAYEFDRQIPVGIFDDELVVTIGDLLSVER